MKDEGDWRRSSTSRLLTGGAERERCLLVLRWCLLWLTLYVEDSLGFVGAAKDWSGRNLTIPRIYICFCGVFFMANDTHSGIMLLSQPLLTSDLAVFQ